MLFPTLATPPFFAPLQTLRQLERLLTEPDPDLVGSPTFALHTRDDGVLLRAALPGIEAQDLTLEIEKDTLTLSGRWPAEPEAERPLAQHVERPRGEFERSLRLPFEIDAARVQARLQNGVLEIELPRHVQAPPVKIQVLTEGPKN